MHHSGIFAFSGLTLLPRVRPSAEELNAIRRRLAVPAVMAAVA